jgi:hypothetical protein
MEGNVVDPMLCSAFEEMTGEVTKAKPLGTKMESELGVQHVVQRHDGLEAVLLTNHANAVGDVDTGHWTLPTHAEANWIVSKLENCQLIWTTSPGAPVRILLKLKLNLATTNAGACRLQRSRSE